MEYIRKEKKKHVPPSEKRSSYAIFSPSQTFGGWLGENKTCIQRKVVWTYKSTTSCPCFLRAEMTWLKARLQAGVGGIVPISSFLVNTFSYVANPLPSSQMTPHFNLRPSSRRLTFCQGKGTH